ncbi:MAG: helix-turn-helix domain-containing protein, partial [Moorea sp. SIO3C2]|nr:helix-turn-helix domain-containing protein [Moorena sp. SIO3C2]
MNENKVPLQQQQEKKLAEMGSSLCQLRTQQCKTIEEIAACTRINARFLRAIEQGKLDQLPEPVYVQGFIKHF